MSDNKNQKKTSSGAGQSVKKPAAPAPASARPGPFVGGSETGEPTASRSVPLPMILVILLGVFAWVADDYFIKHSGAFEASVYYPEHKVPTAPGGGPDGRQVFLNYCAACHQPNGTGSRQLNFPPLAGSEWVAAEGPNRLIRIVLHGLNGPIEVSGEQYNNVMLPWKDTMDDAQIAAVLSYIRSAWGNDAPEVTPEQVAEIRAATDSRPNSWTAAELLQIPESN